MSSIARLLAAALGVITIASLAATGASAQVAPSPAPSSAPVTDPCGDSSLIATTDRPTFGTNPCVVKPGTAIDEFGYRNTSTSGARGSQTVSIPGDRGRVGLAPNLELVLDLPSAIRVTSSNVSASGASNFGTGLKYEIGYGPNYVHGVAAEVVYPTAGARFSNGLPSFNGSYQFGFGITPRFGGNLTLGVNRFNSPNPAGGGNVSATSFQPSLILGDVIAAQTKLNIEVAGSSANGPGTSGQYFGNVFLQRELTRYLLVDVEDAQRFTVVNGTHQHYVGFGAAVRI
jgi:hypothetical protein